jgi:hypothetical protein
LKKIIVKPNLSGGNLFTYLTSDFIIDDNKFFIFTDNRGNKRMIPMDRVIEVIIENE